MNPEIAALTLGSARASRAHRRALASMPRLNFAAAAECFGEAPKRAREGACAPQS